MEEIDEWTHYCCLEINTLSFHTKYYHKSPSQCLLTADEVMNTIHHLHNIAFYGFQ